MIENMLCWLGFHKWIKHTDEEGVMFARECVNCYKYQEE